MNAHLTTTRRNKPGGISLSFSPAVAANEIRLLE